MVSGNIGRSAYAQAQEITAVLARAILALLKGGFIETIDLMRKVTIILSKLKRLITFLSINLNNTQKKKAILSRRLLKQLAIILGCKANEDATHAYTIEFAFWGDGIRKKLSTEALPTKSFRNYQTRHHQSHQSLPNHSY